MIKDLDRRVVVTGYGNVTPVGLNSKNSWENLTNWRQSGIVNIRKSHIELPGIYADDIEITLGAPVRNFDLLKRKAFTDYKKEIKTWHRSVQLGLAAGHEALVMAGLANHNETNLKNGIPPKTRFGISIGTGIGGAASVLESRDHLNPDSHSKIRPSEILVTLPGRVAEVPSIVFGAQAFCHTVLRECATGNAAIGNAVDQIRLGRADVVLAGGTEAPLIPELIGQFSATRALDRSINPKRSPRPLDEDRGGLVMGEGAGMLVIESLEHAIGRQARIFAEIIGYGESSDAVSATDPSTDGIQRALHSAIKDAKLEPEDLQNIHINGHFTATANGDPIELKAITNVFDETQIAGISATKGATGHMNGGTSSVEAIFAIQAMNSSVMPPNIKLSKPIMDSAIIVGPKPRKQTIDYVLNNSFGFGGLNTVLIMAPYKA